MENGNPIQSRSLRHRDGGPLDGLMAVVMVALLLGAAVQVELAKQIPAAGNGAAASLAQVHARQMAGAVIPGILNVADQVPIYPQTPLRAARDARRYRIDDADIQAMIEAQYLWHTRLMRAGIRVGVHKGVAYIVGVVRSPRDAHLATEIAANTRGVLKVADGLEVAVQRHGMMNVAKRQDSLLGDLWTSTRIKAVITFDRRLCGSDVRVMTEGGVVKLSGTVASARQGVALLDIVQDIVGVRRVSSEMRLPQAGVAALPSGRSSPLQPAVHRYLIDDPCAPAPAGGPVLLM